MVDRDAYQPDLILQGMGGFRVVIQIKETGQARVEVTDGDGHVAAYAAMAVRSPDEVLNAGGGTRRAPILIRYSGAASHPAGDLAPVSWFNEVGHGLLRLVEPGKRFVVMPFVGRLRSPHAPVGQRDGQRGPSRASDLWLVVAAWCLPAGFAVSDLVSITGLTELTVRTWLTSMLEAGFICADPQAGARQRAKRYVFVAAERTALEGFVQQRWQEWRSGTGHPSLRPSYRHFIAQHDWKEIHRILRSEKLLCFPSGITFLEGGPGCGPRSWILPGGSIPELFIYTSADDVPLLTGKLDITLLAERSSVSGVAVSTLCVLPPRHPALQLYRRRRESAIYANAWPWGIAALDAWDHEDARVRQAAREAWREWMENQDIEGQRHRGRRS
jgi:hypothetical protein